MANETFTALLDGALRDEPGRPLITAYDEEGRARTELSVTTYANWVAKTANLFLDEYLLDPGDTVRITVSSHWLTPVFVGAALAAGLATTDDPDLPAALIVCGPDEVDDLTTASPILACSLTPFATRFTTTLPDGVDDYGLLWPGQSDAFVGPPAAPNAVAARSGDTMLTQADVVAHGHAEAARWIGTRVLTDANLVTAANQALLLGALAHKGSLVLIANPFDDLWPERYAAERPTDVRDTHAVSGTASATE